MKVRLKKGRRSVTAEGDSLASARGKALAGWQKKYGERAKGASFDTLEGSDEARPTAPKGKGKGKGKAKPRKPNPAQPEPEKKPAAPVARIPDADRIVYLDRIVLGWSGRRPAVAHTLSGKGSLQAAQRLAESDAIRGRDRTVLSVHSTYGGGRGSGAGGSVAPDGMGHGDRMVLAFDGRGRLIEWHHIRAGARSLDEAVALAGSDRVGGATRIVGTVHSTYR